MSRLADIAAQLAKLSEELNKIALELDSKDSTFDRAVDHLMVREGFRLTVYKDTLGIPTVGVGHVVKPEDGLTVGETVTKERAYAFLQRDAENAFNAASSQLNELGLTDSNFLVALSSVNFQLGTSWFKKFPKTWALIKSKQYKEAAFEAAKSNWAKQTPIRVKDFQEALMKLLRSN
jgi:GH24 family phage-related lysozyme (muramidase)